jgi:hypothetical protein
MPPIKQDTNNQKKWAIFTNIDRETKFITKLFRDQNINIAYSTRNTLEKHLCPKRPKKGTVQWRWSLQLEMPKLSRELHRPNRTILQC